MSLSKRNIQQLYVFSAIACWLLLTFTDGLSYLQNQTTEQTYVAFAVRYIFLSIFTYCIFLFYKLTIGGFDGQGFNDLLWKSFVTGFISTLAMLGSDYLSDWLMSRFPKNDQLIGHALYQTTVATCIVFVSSVFFTFKKMILYQKSKETANLWNVFEYLVYLSVVFNFLYIPKEDVLFSLAAVPIVVMGVILSLNLKWIAYLNFNQKWMSILFLVIIAGFDSLFFFQILKQSTENTLIIDIANNLFVLTLLGFIIIYAVFSILVLLFNLPTSSVFEQKFGEVVNLQKLSNSAQIGKSEEEVYDLLIESSTGTFVANAAALEIYDATGNPKKIIYRNIDKNKFYALKTFLRKNNLKIDSEYLLLEDLKRQKNFPERLLINYQSMLAMPLINYGEKLGLMYLVSEIKNGFDKELISIVGSYVNQASIAIANFRLIQKAVVNARYKEDLEIAKRVQDKLLPRKSINDEYIEMATFTESPDEVGGDYYDFYKDDNCNYSIAIGDVSGKGTSASFHMANLKGIFHSLVQFGLDSVSFMEKSNLALSVSLAKSSFATLSLLQLNFTQKKFENARAGHCPILHYSARKKLATYLEPKGLGLGIIRNDNFRNTLEPLTGTFESGDLFVGFTDGIVEACNANDEEFGYSRIKNFVVEHYFMNPQQLIEAFANHLHQYCGQVKINDDHTILVIRIK